MISTKFNILGISFNIGPTPDTEFNFHYNSDGSYSIYQKSTTRPSGDIIFPDTYNGKPITGQYPEVVADGDGAFFRNTAITSCVINKNAKEISRRAFDECANLKKLIIPRGVALIDGYSIRRCSSLTSIELPDTVKSIGNSAFAYDSNLTSIKFGNGLTNILSWTFSQCKKLVNMTFPVSIKAIGSMALAYGPSNRVVKMEGKSMTTVKNMSDYPWGLAKGSKIICSNGTINI